MVQVSEPFTRTAPGAPGDAAYWTTGAKQGVGTAFYSGNGESQSNVWFTLANGALTEVYFPTVACANLRMLQLGITDGSTFFHLEAEDLRHEVELTARDALIYKQINVDPQGRYRIEKTYVADPDDHVVLIRVNIFALRGNVEDYQIFVVANPAIRNGALDNNARFYNDGSDAFFIADDGAVYMSLACSCPWSQGSVGFASASDGLADLRERYRLFTTYTTALLGNVVMLGQVKPAIDEEGNGSFDLSLGFGASSESSRRVAQRSLKRSFERVAKKYHLGWSSYIRNLRKPTAGDLEQYYAAVMVVKAHEDKLTPGAVVASLTIPWGDAVAAGNKDVGGYHTVWSRDLYQAATAMYLAGDRAFAQRALAYLDVMQQQKDGSFPQNSWLDGTPHWRGLQMDQTAFPILLADLLGEDFRFSSLVKPAADFIVKKGPYSEQERWEENPGYSPSTIAAQIAGLVTAARMANSARDYASAAMYLYKADAYEAQLNDWTVAAHGGLADRPYFMRISDTLLADDHHAIEIKNGGGLREKSLVVDAGFLELVRLGIRHPDDQIIVDSLNIIDQTILSFSASGPLWYRYNYDGYGETADGKPYTGTGKGRPWPFLSGERGEYEIALAHSRRRAVPEHVFGPQHLLQTMAGCANGGRLIPEQVWDVAAIPERNLFPGRGTGSATPLVWALAQYIRLAEDVRRGEIAEQPSCVRDRYLTWPTVTGPIVRIDWDQVVPTGQTTTGLIPVVGQTEPFTTVVLAHRNDWTSVRADANGQFAVTMQFHSAGLHEVTVIGYDNDRAVSADQVLLAYTPQEIFQATNANADVHGLGMYQYPKDSVFQPGDFRLTSVRVSADGERIYWDISLGFLDNPWGAPTGISKQMIDIYVANPKLDSHLGQTATKGLNIWFHEDSAWHKLIRISGNWHGEAHVYNPDWSYGGPLDIRPDYQAHCVHVSLSIEEMGGIPEAGWGFMVVVAGESEGEVRLVRAAADEWSFGGAVDDDPPYVLDYLIPQGHEDHSILHRGGIYELPMVRIS